MAPEDPQPPGYQMATWLVLGFAIVIVLGLFMVRTEYQPDSSRDYPSRPMLPDAVPVLLPPPPMDDEYVPCSDCHDEEPPNPTQRELEDEHDEMDFAHGELWCMDCHDLNDREKLHLADATPIAFEESWQLCTQCHGKKLADWRAGVHGKRTGHWRGEKEYRQCVACHNPHRPPFEALEPEPPPRPPTQITRAGVVAAEAGHE
ncbi:MAG: hypothetical protein JRH16_15120 [Deltaproteobacteria bacterium]|nr:hypothetical protein [Deltaproteobacteria bacterium]MBW2421389.1 hypothetical protein [Deltaproteobacteria bacterium]